MLYLTCARLFGIIPTALARDASDRNTTWRCEYDPEARKNRVKYKKKFRRISQQSRAKSKGRRFLQNR